MRAAVLALAIASAALAATTGRAETVVLKPSSPWNVDFGENKCRLTRFFGDQDSKHVLIFEQYWPEDSLGMTVAGGSFKRFKGGQPTDLSFFGADAAFSTQPITGTLNEYGEALVFSRVRLSKGSESAGETAIPRAATRELDTSLAEQVAAVTLKQRDSDIRLITGPLGEAFKVLNLCTKDLVASWGFDAEQQQAAIRRPRWTNEAIISRKILKTYPSRAVMLGEQAMMRMRLIVNEEGEIEDCLIIQTTIAKNFEGQACQAMKGATFEPALDAQGRPMRSFYGTAITYRMN